MKTANEFYPVLSVNPIRELDLLSFTLDLQPDPRNTYKTVIHLENGCSEYIAELAGNFESQILVTVFSFLGNSILYSELYCAVLCCYYL